MAKTKRISALLLRLMALGATLSAAIVMATSHETTTFFSVSIEAKYSNSPAFKYFMIANAIVSVYGLLVLFVPPKSLLWRIVVALDLTEMLHKFADEARRSRSKGFFWQLFMDVFNNYEKLVHGTGQSLDQLNRMYPYGKFGFKSEGSGKVFTMLLTSSISAALAIAQVGKKGNSSAGWLPICSQVPNYCEHVKGALIAGFAGVILYLILLVYSIHTVLDPHLLQKT